MRALMFCLSFCLVACGGPPLEEDLPVATEPEGEWVLTWWDDFDGPANTAPDATKWGYDIGGSGWGNAQLEFNTDRVENVSLDGEGHLVITARAEAYGGNAYTSARILTQQKFQQAYGRFEARIKLPLGQGIWPAFWMLGEDIDQVNWPNCGEIDILELRGQEPDKILGSVHGPGYSGANPISGGYTLPGSQTFADDFHTFAVEWDPERIVWYVDDELFHIVTPAQLPGGSPWVFDHPFFLILNVAVGGNFLGSPDATTSFPQQMVVDHVRVYRRTP